MSKSEQIPPGWTRIPWDGNSALKLECWRKKFGRGHVSVGIGEFLSIVFSYGANSDNSFSGTRRLGPGQTMTEAEAMRAVDARQGHDCNPFLPKG